jgi:hypothetical protein
MYVKETTIIMKKKMKLKQPILIVGLPGIGNVGKLVAEHLKKEFAAEKIAVLYSPHFPHQVVMLKNGGIRLVGNRFYLLKTKDQKRDIVLLTGEAQAVTPEGQYEVNSKIVDFFKEKMGGTFIYTLGGYNVSRNMTETPKVYGNVTRREVIAKFKNTNIIFGKSRGMIWGSAGLILAFAKLRKLDGICIMGETGFLDVDASSAKAVLLELSKCIGLPINTRNLDKIIEKTAKMVKELEKQAQGFPTQFGEAGGQGGTDRPIYIR